jgi:fructose-specific phosphotransferase system IIC component
MNQTMGVVLDSAWLITGIVCTVWVHALYRSKNRRGFGTGWLGCVILGFLMGPLAVILAALTRPFVPTQMCCPYCRFVIPIGALVCGHCGSVLAPLPGMPEVVDVTPEHRVS